MGGWAELKKPDWADLKTESSGLTGCCCCWTKEKLGDKRAKLRSRNTTLWSA